MGTIADIEDKVGGDQISIYVVREGDNLSQIASMFNVSVNTIIWSNDIDRGSKIVPGQTDHPAHLGSKIRSQRRHRKKHRQET